MTLEFYLNSLDSPKLHNNKQIEDSERAAIPVFCEVKLLNLLMEFGWFGENDISLCNGAFPLEKAAHPVHSSTLFSFQTGDHHQQVPHVNPH